MAINYQDRHQQILTWLDDIADYIEIESTKVRQVNQKTRWNDLVTDMDLAIEDYLSKKIQETFPGDRIVGEESAGSLYTGTSNYSLEGNTWFIDPIDGTVNYVTKQADYAVMIAFYQDGIGQLGYILDMNNRDVYYAIKGQGLFLNDKSLDLGPTDFHLDQGLIAVNSKIVHMEEYDFIRKLTKQSLGIRMLGSAGLEILSILKKNTVAYLSSSLAPWDIAAGKILIEEAGLRASNFSGREFMLDRPTSAVFAYPKAYDQVLNHIH